MNNRRHTLTIAVLSGIALAVLSIQAAFASEAALSQQPKPAQGDSAPQQPWPAFMHDAQHTGQSTVEYSAPAAPVIKWSTHFSSMVNAVVIGANGTLVVASQTGITALNPLDGSQVWSVVSGESDGLAVGPQDEIYSSFYSGGVARYDGPNRTYTFIGPGAYGSYAVPTVYDGAGYTAFVGRIHSFNLADGSLRWTYNTGSTGVQFPPATVSQDGQTVYVAASLNSPAEGRVYALDNANGSLRWQISTGQIWTQAAPLVGPDGTLYIASRDSYLYALDPTDGSILWSFQADSGIWTTPAMGKNGLIYFSTQAGTVYAIDRQTGSLRWQYATGNFIDTSLSLGADETVYVSTAPGLLAIDGLQGTLKWEYTADTWGYMIDPAIGPDGTIYMSSYDETNHNYALYAIRGGKLFPSANKPPASLSVTGPLTGTLGVPYTFSAAVSPITTTLPLTYTWQASGQPQATFTSGLTGTISYTWHTAGPQVITVSAANDGGSISATHLIATQPGVKTVFGTIAKNTTWTRDNVYILTNNVGVAPGYTLTVEAGTLVKFNGNFNLNVGGTLVADGTHDDPILFTSNSSGSWGRIYFDDPSQDAHADSSGAYQGGNLLRWVEIQKASQGIACNYATPYLSHVTSDGGGMSCSLGSTPLWLAESSLVGNVNISGVPPSVTGSWATKASMPSPKYWFGLAAASNGKIYAMGPGGSNQEYDPTTNVWTNRTGQPVSMSEMSSVTASNGKIYTFGTSGSSMVTEEYDPDTDTWAVRASLTRVRQLFGLAGGPDGKIYVIGGSAGEGVADVDAYDPATDTWEVRAPLPAPRYGPGAATGVNGKIYAFDGGFNGVYYADVFEYDPVTNVWTTKPSHDMARLYFGTAAASNGKIYTLGGTSGPYQSANNEYDPLTDTWVSRPPMPTARSLLAAAAAANGKIYAVGGRSLAGDLSTVEEYTPPSETTAVHVLNTTLGGSLTAPDYAEITGCTVSGPVSSGNGSKLNGSTVGGSLTINGNGSVTNSSTAAISVIWTGFVQENRVSGGSISVGGASSVLTNTVTRGGIIAASGSLVQGNDVEGGSAWGIIASGATNVLHNRVVGSLNGVAADLGLVQGNLIANSTQAGLQVSGGQVLSNTLTGNLGSALVIASGAPVVRGNNLELNKGAFDLVNNGSSAVDAAGNWWGSTDPAAIDERILDFNDEYQRGLVSYDPPLTSPVRSAPAYLRSVTQAPPGQVGLDTYRYTLQFSRDMDQSVDPGASFATTLKGAWDDKNTGNSPLCGNSIRHMTADLDGNIWIATYDGGLCSYSPQGVWSHYSFSGWPEHLFADELGGVWVAVYGGGVVYISPGGALTTYTTSNSGVPSNNLTFAEKDRHGALWVVTDGSVDVVAAKMAPDGSWTYISKSSSPLQGPVNNLAVDNQDRVWFGNGANGVMVLSPDGSWTTYNPSNSILLGNIISLSRDREGNLYLMSYSATGAGSPGFTRVTPSGVWTNFTPGNSPILPEMRRIVEDDQGNVWFTYWGGVSALRPDGSWEVYQNAAKPGLKDVHGIAFAENGDVWIGSYFGGGVTVFHRGLDYQTQPEPGWTAPDQFQASYDFNTLVAPGAYALTVSGGVGADGIEIAPYGSFGFTLAYSASLPTAPPPSPVVRACASPLTTTLTAQWQLKTDQAIDLYRYAIGTGPGQNDVLDWTATTAAGFTRSDLSLVSGQAYYISVKARNTGRLWGSTGGSNPITAGTQGCPVVGFSASPLSGMTPLAVSFASQVSGTVTSSSWSFGNSVTSPLASPVYTYTVPGVYTITLDVFGPGGWTTLVKPAYISVAPDSAPPGGSLTIQDGAPFITSTQVSLEIAASDPSGVGGLHLSNDGITYTAWISYTPVQSWTLSAGDGLKTVYAQVRDLPGNLATFTDTIGLYTASPLAGFISNAPNGLGQTTIFTNTTRGVDPISYIWDFGDGNTSLVTHPMNTYTDPGVYTVTLTASNPAMSAAATARVIVYRTPQASFETSSPDWLGQTTVFSNTTSLAPVDDGTVSYRWDFGDGSGSNAASPAHTYSVAGLYSVVMTTTNFAGQSVFSGNVTIYGAPSAAFQVTNPLWLDQTAVFTNTTQGTPSPDPTIAYQWDFGDGETASSASVTHTYAVSGAFTVTLTAANSAGSSHASQTVLVYSQPAPAFSAAPLSGYVPLEVNFGNESATIPPGDPSLAFTWQFGDGDTSDLAQPSHIYTSPGVYTVTLSVENPAGRQEAIRSSYIVVLPPPADLEISKKAWAPTNRGFSDQAALPGYPITYTLEVTNTGQSTALSVVVTDTLPDGVSFLSQTDPFTFTQSGSRLVWQLGDLPAASARQIKFSGTVSVSASGQITNQAEVSTSSAEPELANNQVELTTLLNQPQSVLSVSPRSPTLEVIPGGQASLQAVVRNTGTGPVSGLTFIPPAHIPWVYVESGGLSELAPGASATITITASPASGLNPGAYRDLIRIKDAQGGQTFIALTVLAEPVQRSLTVTVNDDQGKLLSGVLLTLTAQQPWVVVTEGSSQTSNPTFQQHTDGQGQALFDSLSAGSYSYTLQAKDHDQLQGSLSVSGEPASQSVTLTLTAHPNLTITPRTAEWGVTRGAASGTTLILENQGAAPLGGIMILPPAHLPWVTLGSAGSIPSLAPGESVEISVFASPPADQAPGVYQDTLLVIADGGQSIQAVLSVTVSSESGRDLLLQVVDPQGRPVISGTVTLVQQDLSLLETSGITTTYNRQFSLQVDGSGFALFASLPPGGYNYLVQANNYDDHAGSLFVQPGDGPQAVVITLSPAPFMYDWQVVPIQDEYGITLTMTYDIHSAGPPLVIPARYWDFRECNPALNDTITLYNLSAGDLSLQDFAISVPGVDVQVGSHPDQIGPHASVDIQVTATNHASGTGQGAGYANYTYMVDSDRYVTFSLNPSSLTSDWLAPGSAFSQTYQLQPGVFDPAVQYTLAISQPASLPWATLAITQTAPLTWTASTRLPLQVSVQPPLWLDEGLYQGSAQVSVRGSDGTQRSGSLAIEVTRSADGFQVHTSFALGPIPFTQKSATGVGEIHTSVSPCGSGGPGGNPSQASSGGWDWHPVSFGGLGKLIGYLFGPNPSAPSFPRVIPAPLYQYVHEQASLQLSQRMMLEGEGFRANLALKNTSPNGMDLSSVDVLVKDGSGVDRTADFIVIPDAPPFTGSLDPGQSSKTTWLILPSSLNVILPTGERFGVQAVIHYSWNGGSYTLATVPEEITVFPAPRLDLTYQLPRADCSSTIFDMRTVIHNKGQGPARDLRFSSSQPFVIDNQTGKPLGFQIIQTYINNIPQAPGLNLSLGDLAPGETITATWRIQSNQPGRFVEFTSNYRQLGYQGLPLNPVIDRVDTVFDPSYCGITTGSFQGSLQPVFPAEYSLPSQVMQGGILSRYFRLVDQVGHPIPDARVTFSTGFAEPTDQDGNLTYVVSADQLGGPGRSYVVSPQSVAIGNQIQTIAGTSFFSVAVDERRYSNSWSLGAVREASAGISTGVIAYVEGKMNGGMELSLDESDPNQTQDDRVEMKETYSSSAGIGAGLGVKLHAGVAVVDASATSEVSFRDYGSVDANFDAPYSSPQAEAQGVYLLLAMLDAAQGQQNQPLMIAMLKAAGQHSTYLDAIQAQTAGVAVMFKDTVGASVKSGLDARLPDQAEGKKETLKISLAELGLSYVSSAELSDLGDTYSVAYADEVSADVSLFSIDLPLIKDQLTQLVGSRVIKIRKEYIADKKTGLLLKVNITLSGEGNPNVFTDVLTQKVSVRYTLDGSDLTIPTLNQVGALHGLQDVAALLQSAPEISYEVDVEDSASLSLVPSLTIPGTEISIGGGLELGNSRSLVRRQGTLVNGKPYDTSSYTADSLVSRPGSSWTVLTENALGGLWSAMGAGFHHMTQQLLDTGLHIGITGSNLAGEVRGGADLTSSGSLTAPTQTLAEQQMGLPDSSRAAVDAANTTAPMDELLSSGEPVTVTAIAWTPEMTPSATLSAADGSGFVVGGIYEFQPYTLTLSPAASLVLTYTDEAAAGLNKDLIGLYRWDGAQNNWQALPGQADPAHNRFGAEIDRLGTYALGYDSAPPEIIDLTPGDGSQIGATQPQIHALIADTGVGLDPSTPALSLDGVPAAATFITSTGELSYVPLEPLAIGSHTIDITAADVRGSHTSLHAVFYVLTPPETLNLSGPITTSAQTGCAFTAEVAPLTTTAPVTYTWSASEQDPLTVSGGLLDTRTFSWNTSGVKTVSVTASTSVGSLSATRQITVEVPLEKVSLNAPHAGWVDQSLTFTAAAEPITATQPVTYLWEFGDGASGSGQVVTHTYPADGLYMVTVSATNALNQVSADQPIDIVIPLRGLRLDSDSPTVLGSATAITATLDSGSRAGLFWQLGDGSEITTSVLGANTVLTHTYAAPGSYPVSLRASNPLEELSATITVTVQAPVEGLAIHISPPIELGRPAVLIAGLTSGSAVEYTWDLGDGSQAAGEVITHTFTALGTYTVTLSAQNLVSTAQAQLAVEVVDIPIQDLSASNTGPTDLGKATRFDSQVSAGTHVAYTWDFGDGVLGEGAQVTHTYTTVGEFTAVITATNGRGISTAQTPVTIRDVLISGLGATNDGPTELGSVTSFTATVAAGSNVIYAWDFGDGTSGEGAVIAHPFAATGIYTTTVTASNGRGSDSTQMQVEVVDVPIQGLQAACSSPTDLGSATLFTATVQAGSSISYTWDFGDAAQGAGAHTWHIYPSVGVYTAALTAMNGIGDQTAHTVILVQEGSIQGLAAGNTGPVNLGEPITLTAQISAGTNVSYSWDFGDGETGFGASVEHLYPAVGEYIATVTAFNSRGFLSDQSEVVIQDAPVEGLLVSSSSPTELGSATAFTATLQSGSNVGFSWDFGDGQSGSGVSAMHVYPQTGIYTTTLTALNTRGSQTARVWVEVIDIPISGLAFQSNSPVKLGQDMVFTATVSGGSHVAFAWDFGDGQSGSGAAVSHHYASAGKYTARVTASNGRGSSQAQAEVRVLDIPIAGLAVENDSPSELGSATRFTATVVAGTNLAYSWDFGDGQSGSGASPNHIYPALGVYTATLTAQNSLSVQSVVSRVTVVDAPIRGLQAANDGPTMLGGSTQFSATVASGTSVIYTWDFGDGSSGEGAVITHTYASAGIYTATLSAVNGISQASVTVKVVIIEGKLSIYLPLVTR